MFDYKIISLSESTEPDLEKIKINSATSSHVYSRLDCMTKQRVVMHQGVHEVMEA